MLRKFFSVATSSVGDVACLIVSKSRKSSEKGECRFVNDRRLRRRGELS